jgi:Zn-dependent M28 family amino/carboxypeptidase
MNTKHFIIYLGILVFLLTACEQTTKRNYSKENRERKKQVSVPPFNADSAYFFVEKQVSFGPRVPGTKAHSACAAWLIQTLEKYADTVYRQQFKARTYDNVTRKGMNIIASFKPNEEKRVLLMAHWDSRPFGDHDEDPAFHNKPIDGANDGASGVAVLLEMARQFHGQVPDAGVDIILFDLEDWGPPTQLEKYKDEYWGLGSQHWSKTPHIYGYRAAYGILLDMVGAENPTFTREYFSNKYAPYILDMVWSQAADLGYANYFLDEDGSAINDDHVFVNRLAKIPSIDIIHLTDESSDNTFFEHWHTSKDNLDAIDKNSLRIVGEVVMGVVYRE